jgi:hypothetical protein
MASATNAPILLAVSPDSKFIAQISGKAFASSGTGSNFNESYKAVKYVSSTIRLLFGKQYLLKFGFNCSVPKKFK